MSVPDFSKEQLDYLSELLTPGCCHTTGEHNPRHFLADPTDLCQSQRSEAWDHAVEQLGIDIEAAVSHEHCGHCKRHVERLKKGVTFQVLLGGPLEAPPGSHVLLFNAPDGYPFDKKQIKAILSACTELFGTVIRHWNGEGSTGFSVLIKKAPTAAKEKNLHKRLRPLFVPDEIDAERLYA